MVVLLEAQDKKMELLELQTLVVEAELGVVDFLEVVVKLMAQPVVQELL